MSDQERYVDLVRRKKEIEFQLANPSETDKDGNQLDRRAFLAWKRRAQYAVMKIDQELTALKQERRVAQEQKAWRGSLPEGRPDPSRCEWLLRLVDAKDDELRASGEEELSHEEVIALVDRAVREQIARRVLGGEAKGPVSFDGGAS